MPGLSIVRLHGSFHFRFWYNPRLSIVWFHDSFHFRFSVRQRVLIRFIFVNQKLFDVGRTCLAARNLFGCEKLVWVRETILGARNYFWQLGSFLPARFFFASSVPIHHATSWVIDVMGFSLVTSLSACKSVVHRQVSIRLAPSLFCFKFGESNFGGVKLGREVRGQMMEVERLEGKWRGSKPRHY